MCTTLPRWNKDSVIIHEQLNLLAEAIERADSWQVDSSSGLMITESGTNRTIGAVQQRGATYARVSTTIKAMNGTQFGMGTIDVGYKDANNNFQSYGGAPEDCYNSTSAVGAVGNIIQAKWISEDWAWDVADCGATQ